MWRRSGSTQGAGWWCWVLVVAAQWQQTGSTTPTYSRRAGAAWGRRHRSRPQALSSRTKSCHHPVVHRYMPCHGLRTCLDAECVVHPLHHHHVAAGADQAQLVGGGNGLLQRLGEEQGGGVGWRGMGVYCLANLLPTTRGGAATSRRRLSICGTRHEAGLGARACRGGGTTHRSDAGGGGAWGRGNKGKTAWEMPAGQPVRGAWERGAAGQGRAGEGRGWPGPSAHPPSACRAHPKTSL